MRRPARPKPTPELAAPFFARKLSELDAALGETLPRVKGRADGEAIHDMRVAIRRLRTILKLARKVYGRFHADVVRRAFTDVQRATGALRDEEVLGETLGALAIRDAAFGAWRKRRHARERALRGAVIRSLDQGDLDRARKLLEALVALPVKPSRDAELAKLARKSVERAGDEVEARADVAPDDTLGLHELRIAYKHLRYSIEIFTEALPAEVAARVKLAVQFQKRLGEIHDYDVALETVKRARGLPVATRRRVTKALEKKREEHVGRFLLLRARETAPPRDETRARQTTRPPRAQAAPPASVTRSAASRSGRSRPS